MSAGSGKGKWFLVALVAIAAGLGGLFAGRPDLFAGLLAALGRGAVPELAASHVKVGYVDLQRDTYAGIERAIDNFEKAVALAPGYAAAMAAICEAHLARAEYMAEEADDLAGQLIGAKKGKQEQLEREIAQLRRGAERRRDEAFRYGTQAVKIDPEGLAANRAMADFYRLTQARQQMVELLAKAETEAPLDPGVAYVRGSAAAGEPAAAERAIRYLDTALERAPRMQRARYKLARVRFQQGEINAARIQLEALLGAVPEHERAKVLMERLDEPQEEPEPPEPEPEPDPEPEDEPEIAGPPSFERIFNRAERLRRADQPTRALPIYFQALDEEPRDIGSLLGVGWCYIDMEQPTTAIDYFNRARGVDPNDPEAHVGLAEAYKLKGMKRDAVRYYRRYLEIAPYGTEADVARRQIEQLQGG